MRVRFPSFSPMEIEQYIFACQAQNLLKNKFDQAMEKSKPNEFIDRPKTLSKATKMKFNLLPSIKEVSKEVNIEIERRKKLFQNIDEKMCDLDSYEYAISSMMTENKLIKLGAIYGNKAYNFCLSSLKIPSQDLKNINNVALQGFTNARKCKPDIFPRNSVEKYLNEKDLSMNGARVDIIQTNNGPKIIEINYQWVDGIQALEALRTVAFGVNKLNVTDQLAQVYKDKSNLGIIFLNPATGSRENGEFRSLEIMAKKFVSKNIFSNVEIINPEIYRPEYIKKFSSLYIDGDPKMIYGSEIPDWLVTIYDKAKLQNITIFPTWNPQFDKKSILIEASRRWPELFANTYKFSDQQIPNIDINTPNWVLKGDGFSSRQVAISQTELFNNIYEDALLFPNEYVYQPKLQSVPIKPMWGFDTSSDEPVYLKNPNCKYNVWIIDGKIAGTMASISNKDIISDKDFNTIPIPC